MVDGIGGAEAVCSGERCSANRPWSWNYSNWANHKYWTLKMMTNAELKIRWLDEMLRSIDKMYKCFQTKYIWRAVRSETEESESGSKWNQRKKARNQKCHAPAERKDARLILEIWANGLHHLQSSRPLIAVSWRCWSCYWVSMVSMMILMEGWWRGKLSWNYYVRLCLILSQASQPLVVFPDLWTDIVTARIHLH